MRGHVREYRPGKWSYIVDAGKKENGKRKQIEKGGFSTKKEADAALAKKLVELNETGDIFIPSEKTFDECYNEFFKFMKPSWTQSTIIIKERVYNLHIKEAIGYRFIKTIKPSDINNILIGKSDDGFSPEYINSIKKVLRGVIKYAIDQGYIKNDPTDKIIAPKIIRKPIEVFDKGEISVILKLFEGSIMHPVIMIAVYTGMRAGEIIGLRWQDIDFEHKKIDINHQMIRDKGRTYISIPKHNSQRVISIPQILIDYLLNFKRQQESNKEIAAELYTTHNKVFNYITNREELIDDFVIVKPDGCIINRGSLTSIARKCKKHGITAYPHKFRHTYATALLEAGCSIKLLQETLGHKSAQLTLDIYSHVSKKHEKDIFDKLTLY